jgi:predicted ATP-grasp superfamily ATP-dependent carboligase
VAHDKEPPVLFLTEEASVRAVSAARQALSSRVRVRLPAHPRLEALMHKAGFQHLAEALRAPIPPFVELRSKLDLPRVKKLQYPCVLKPAAKDYAYGERFKKAYVVGGPDEVVRLYREIEPVCPNMVVQQWIEGEDKDIFFCLQYAPNALDAPVASFTGRKIRAWPPRIGGTASCTAAPEVHEELSSLTARFFRDTGVVGMAGMEFKRDRRDGRFYMIEPTIARTDFQHEVATLNGINLPYLAYCFELGLPLPRVQWQPTRRVWREPLIDRWSAQSQGIADEAGFAGAKVVDAWWRAADPLPWLDFIGRRLKARVAKWVR